MGKPWSAAMAVALAFGLGSCSSLPIPGFLTSASTTSAAQSTTKTEFPPRPLTLLYTTFQDHAVLQRDKPIQVWGLTSPGAQVSVTLAGETADATADVSGKWEAVLAPLKAGGPYQMTAHSSAGKTQTVKDVLIGDVYLCSGQSNIELPVRMVMSSDVEMAGATNTKIRLMTVHRFPSATPRDTFGADASWSVTNPASVKEFSAICYFFGRELQSATNVPIGLIHASWGGSVIQAWLSADKVRELGGYQQQLDILSIYVTAPDAAKKKWQEIANTWWREHDPASAATPAWSDPATDDSAWPQIIPTGWWKTWGVAELKTFSGIVWFRTTVNLTAAQAKGGAVLSIGPVNDFDTTWVNGVQAGVGEGWDLKRVYDLPDGTLHEGKNVIAVGVLSLGSEGGMWGSADEKVLKLADGTSIKLNTPWRYHRSAPQSQTGGMPHAPWRNENGLTLLTNGMIAPLGPTAVSGILWYQGESNTYEAQKYERLLTGLIADWRQKFGSDVPFLVVQLPAYGPPSVAPEESQWADLREAQRRVAEQTPKAGLAVTIDLGDRQNLHPVVKQEVGRRLALIAERLIYGLDVADSGPTPVSALRTGNVIAVRFANLAKGFAVYESNRPISFQVCDKAKHCSFVDATQNKDEIDLDAAHIRDAATVRYCWADSPICNVYNSEGLPAVPFEIPIADTTRLRK
ncbi:MAG: sialate O-acetylesterase [Rhizomicrobium sp.]|jgi:sialate O-acetylesterase